MESHEGMMKIGTWEHINSRNERGRVNSVNQLNCGDRRVCD